MTTLVSVLGLSFAAQADPTIDLLFGGADTIATSSGATVTVDVFITLSGADTTLGYQFTVGWDVAELAYLGGSLSNVALPGQGTSGFGELLATGSSLPGSISSAGPAVGAGTYQIGSLQFTVLAGLGNDGTSDITAYLDPANTFGTDFIGTGAPGVNYGATTFNGAGVDIVPEPTTASLLGLGLIGLTIAGRRRS